MGARATLWGYVGFIYECCIKGTQEAWQLLRDASEIRDAESGPRRCRWRNCQGGAIERDGTDGVGCEILCAFSGTGEWDSGQGRQELAPTIVGAAARLRLRETAEAAVAT